MIDDAPFSREVVRPYLIGDDITEEPRQQPRRWVIDFGLRPLEEAMRFPKPLQLVRERVKPERDLNNRKARKDRWWQFGEKAVGMRRAVAPLSRFIACPRVGKRVVFCWVDSSVCAGDATVVFALDDDYAMGILTSSTHRAWAWAEMSTLRVDARYTPTSCFETFPWPQPSPHQRVEIGELAARLVDRRQASCVERDIGLTDFYNQLEEGAWREIADLHRDLDRAVARAYGWPAAVADDPLEIRARLAALHGRIVAGKESYEPFPKQLHAIESGLEDAVAETSTGTEVHLLLRNAAELEGSLIGKGGRGVVIGTAIGEISVDLGDVSRFGIVMHGEGPE